MFQRISIILILNLFILLCGCTKSTTLSDLPNNIVDSSSTQSISSSRPYTSLKIGFRFEKYTTQDYNENEIPNTDIYLIVNSTTTSEYKLGSYVGNAEVIKKDNYEINQIPKDTLIACISWFGGGGDYIFVDRKNSTSLSVMWRYVDASGGDSEPVEIPEYKEVKQINIPNTKQIEVIPLVEIINEN